MAKYLDYSGLSYLWSKIRAYVGAATGSNENLFDNPWFTEGNVINSRKIAYNTTISAANYGIDRWSGVGGGYTLSATGVTAAGVMVQKGNWAAIVGKKVTISALGSDGVIGTWTGTFQAGSFTLSNSKGSGVIANNSQINIGGGGEWAALKLELGELSTLANDAPPDYGEELAKCIYSTADPTDTYANNGFGRTNPNLLDNPWFTVNQRSASGTISTANAYTVDRWKLSGGSVTISANGVSLLKVGSTQGAYREYIEYDRIKTNEQYTFSVMLQSGEVYSVTGTITPQTAQSGWLINKNFTSDLWGGIRAYGQNADLWDICFTSNNTSGVNIRAVKLELGSVSTLANDTPPDYATELAKCQRYFVRFDFNTVYRPAWAGVVTSASQMLATVILPVPMNPIYPTVTLSGTLQFVEFTSSGGVLRTATSIAGNVPITNTMRLNVNTSGSLTVYNSTIVYTASNTCVIGISCDL